MMADTSPNGDDPFDHNHLNDRVGDAVLYWDIDETLAVSTKVRIGEVDYDSPLGDDWKSTLVIDDIYDADGNRQPGGINDEVRFG